MTSETKRSITLEDYDALLDCFVKGMEGLGDHVAGVMLFGSMARGDVKPGLSDAMDAFVNLHAEVFQDRERYVDVIGRLATLSAKLGQYGIHYHPFFCWNSSDPFPALFLTTSLSDTSSKIPYGADIRRSICANETSRAYAAKGFYELRRRALEANYYLVKPELTPGECQRLAGTLLEAKKYLPIAACAAMDIWAGEAELVEELQVAFPELDLSVLRQISQLRNEPSLLEQPPVLCKLLEELLVLIEGIHDRLPLTH
jgi:hypothetical protein